jgi:transposase
MTTTIDTGDICCVALELSKTSWVFAFAVPGDSQAAVHKIKASEVDKLIGILSASKAKAELRLGRPLQIVLCYEVGYDGFWLARLLIARGIRTIVFDPASFLMPRRGRRAKTDRLDAEGMTRTLRAWLSGNREIAHDVVVPSVAQEDAKRIERERKYLVEERVSIVGRIKGLLALHGIWLTGKRIGKGLRDQLDTMRTGDGRPLGPFLRRDIERMLHHYDFVSQQIEEVVADRKEALADKCGRFPHAEKVQLLARLDAVGETTATILVAEVYHRSFETRRHVASFVGLAPSPYNSGETDRNRGINKAGTKLGSATSPTASFRWPRRSQVRGQPRHDPIATAG